MDYSCSACTSCMTRARTLEPKPCSQPSLATRGLLKTHLLPLLAVCALEGLPQQAELCIMALWDCVCTPGALAIQAGPT